MSSQTRDPLGKISRGPICLRKLGSVGSIEKVLKKLAVSKILSEGG
jgi:hypothetical protein